MTCRIIVSGTQVYYHIHEAKGFQPTPLPINPWVNGEQSGPETLC